MDVWQFKIQAHLETITSKGREKNQSLDPWLLLSAVAISAFWKMGNEIKLEISLTVPKSIQKYSLKRK